MGQAGGAGIAALMALLIVRMFQRLPSRRLCAFSRMLG